MHGGQKWLGKKFSERHKHNLRNAQLLSYKEKRHQSGGKEVIMMNKTRSVWE